MAERGGYGVKRNYKLLNWEQNEFPIACTSCMGDSTYLRMLKKPLGAECKICTRPYTTFSWKTEKHKNIKTEICSTCSKINNCCQSCIYDLKYGLPIDVRNKLIGDQKVELLMSEGNRDLFAHLANENYDNLNLPYDKIDKNVEEQIYKGIGYNCDLVNNSEEGESKNDVNLTIGGGFGKIRGNDKNGINKIFGNVEEQNSEKINNDENKINRDKKVISKNEIDSTIGAEYGKIRDFIDKNKKIDPNFEKKLKARKKICRFYQSEKCSKKNCEFLHLKKKDLKTKTDEYYKMTPTQKSITENYKKSKKIFLSENSNFIRMKYISKNEEKLTKEKIENLIDFEFSIIFLNGKSLIKFKKKEQAEKFLKIFLNSFTINGRKIDLEYFHSYQKNIFSEDDSEIPLPKIIDKKNVKDVRNIFLEGLNKKFVYKKKEDREGGKLNLVDY